MQKPGGIGTPDILLLQCEELAVIDNLADRLFLIVYADPAKPGAYAQAAARIAQLQAQLNQSVAALAIVPGESHEVERHFARADFKAAVLWRARNTSLPAIACRLSLASVCKRFTVSPLSLYRARCAGTRAPTYYYDLGDHQVVGSSPEILVRQGAQRRGRRNRHHPSHRRYTRPRGLPRARRQQRKRAAG